MEYLYFKKKVAEMRKDFLRPENMADNGRFTFCQITVWLKRFEGGCCFIAEEENSEMSSPSC